MRSVMVLCAILVAALPVAAQKWTPPRTQWGDPDPQGFWPVVEMLSVPIERPAALGTKATLTDEEFARLPSEYRAPGPNDFFTGSGTRNLLQEFGKPQRQTSLVVDPPDGRLAKVPLPDRRGDAEGPPRFPPPQRSPQRSAGLQPDGKVYLARYARFDGAAGKLQRQSDHPNRRNGRAPQRDGSRSAGHSTDGRMLAQRSCSQAWDSRGRCGRLDASRGNDQLNDNSTSRAAPALASSSHAAATPG